MDYEHSALYKIIKPLAHKKPKVKLGMTEEEYKQYYIAACRFGIMADLRYPVFECLRKFVRIKEFRNKDMWMRGNQQSLTYRTNRIDENLKNILRDFRKQGITSFLFKVYEATSYERIGFVKATTESEASHLASLLYGGLVKSVRIESTYKPIWNDDSDDLFIKEMVNDIARYRKKIFSLKERIKDDKESILQYEKNIEFLNLNLGAFENN